MTDSSSVAYAIDTTETKPALVFFKYKYADSLPAFLLTHTEEHVKCLSEFFRVTVIDEDCDYGAICDRYQPDLTLFESGLNLFACRRLTISNTNSYRNVPKAGLFNADAWAETRSGTLSEMEHWGIETFFAISTTAAEHASDIAQQLFVWPNFIDPAVYHDYGESKLIPVLLTGSTGPQYPWRHRVFKLVARDYPTLSCPHHGYLARSGEAQALYGEPYARAINASLVAPACGTVAKEVVRKHFEIPGCRACLITERSPMLEAAGFVDMQNCVFAEEHDVLDKLRYLFAHREALAAITDAGYELVHSRHTFRQRDQLLQWLRLHKTLQPGQKVIQETPFAPLRLADKTDAERHAPILSSGLHLELLRRGDEQLAAAKVDEAERLYHACLRYMRRFPEAHLRLALCQLWKGDARGAQQWICEPLQYSLAQYHAFDPDPVEWAYFIVTLLCLGRPSEALKRAREFPLLRHPELDRVRWATGILSSGSGSCPLSADEDQPARASVHHLPVHEFAHWVENLAGLLTRCGQQASARKLQKQAACAGHASDGAQRGGTSLLPSRLTSSRTADPAKYFRGRLFRSKLRNKLERHWKNARHTWRKHSSGPAGLRARAIASEGRQALRELLESEAIRSVLVLGADRDRWFTQAVLSVPVIHSENEPPVLCLEAPRPNAPFRFRFRRKSASGERGAWQTVPPRSPEECAEWVRDAVREFKKLHRLENFELIIVNGSEAQMTAPAMDAVEDEFARARFVVLDHVANLYNSRAYRALLRAPDYRSVDQNPDLAEGYVTFERESCDVVAQ